MRVHTSNRKTLKKKKTLKSYFLPLSLFIGIFGLASILTAVKQYQDTRSQASELAAANLATPKGKTKKVRVLFLTVDPHENGQSYIQTYESGIVGGNKAAFEANWINNFTKNINSALPPQYQYVVAKRVDIKTFPPVKSGTRQTFSTFTRCVNPGPSDKGYCESVKEKVDYNKFIQENNLCKIINQNKIDEIWVLSPEYVLTYEAFIFGPEHGLPVNGGSFKINDPDCNKQVIAINPVYERPEEFLHNYGHRVEATIGFMANWWGAQYYTFWDKFFKGDVGSRCGNIHYPPNTSGEYDYSNKNTARSYCSDWNNAPYFKASNEMVNCDKWNCDIQQYYIYWLRSLPRTEAYTTVAGTIGHPISTNWWHYIVDPSLALTCHKGVSTYDWMSAKSDSDDRSYACLAPSSNFCKGLIFKATRYVEEIPNFQCSNGTHVLFYKGERRGYLDYEQAASASAGLKANNINSYQYAFINNPDSYPLELGTEEFCTGEQEITVNDYRQLPENPNCVDYSAHSKLNIRLVPKNKPMKSYTVDISTDEGWAEALSIIIGRAKKTVVHLRMSE